MRFASDKTYVKRGESCFSYRDRSIQWVVHLLKPLPEPVTVGKQFAVTSGSESGIPGASNGTQQDSLDLRYGLTRNDGKV